MLNKISISAEELATAFQTRNYSFQGHTFQLIGRGKMLFSHWKAKGNLILQGEKNILDINFVCLTSSSTLIHLRNLSQEVKICSRQKLVWRDWLVMLAMLITGLSICFLIVFLASF